MPKALPDMNQLLPLTNVAFDRFHMGEYTLGATLYRTGDYDGAIRCFTELAKAVKLRTYDWSFMAMAHYRLGNLPEARRCLAEASRWMGRVSDAPDVALVGTQLTWSTWTDKIVSTAVFAEARELIEETRRQ